MQNIFDYLEWRGDLSFEVDGLNEIDNLVFSTLAYLEYGGIIAPNAGKGSITLSKIAEKSGKSIAGMSAFYTNPFFRQIPNLLAKAAQSARYRDIELSSYVNKFDPEMSKQFSAVVFSINKNLHFIAFRGTDDTLAGWEEDFQMSFKDEVQAQQNAVAYMEKVISSYDGDFYIGGHSKGGNLAVYAAAHASSRMRDRIIWVYNNDGPGFHNKIIKSEGYQKILRKVSTFIPKSSIVGMLLEHGEDYIVVSSSEIGILQHDTFSWQVKGTHFVYAKGLTKSSLNFNKTVRLWLDQLSLEQRAQFVDVIFDIIQATGAMTVSELSDEKLKATDAMIKTFKNMSPETKSLLKKTIELFFDESKKVMRSSIEADINLLFSKRRLKKSKLKLLGNK